MFSARGLRRSLGERVLFEGLAIDVAEGECVGVQGASGSGKTTLLRMLAWLEPCEAQLRLDGRTPTEWGVPRWRTDVCYVAQVPARLPGTPAEHLERVLALKAQRGRPGGDPVALAEGWGLPAATWQQPWSELSGGEAQRAALALAVSRGPRLLLLDEPTSALDDEATAAVEASLAGRAMLWVTHEGAQAARVCDRVVTL